MILKTALTGITFSVNRRHRWVNDAFASMLGYEKHELVGQSSQIHLPDRETWEAFGAAAYPVLATGKPYIAEWRFKRKDGSLFWCQVAGQRARPRQPGPRLDLDPHRRHRAARVAADPASARSPSATSS